MQEIQTPPPMPRFAETVILMDANYVDSVAYDFIANLQNDLKRDIPDCDLPTLLLCNALDGGVEEGNEEVQCILICRQGESVMGHVVPHNLRTEVDGFAFRDRRLGEFSLAVVEEESDDIMAGESLYVQVARVALSSRDVKRLVLVTDWQETKEELTEELADAREARIDNDAQPVNVTILCTGSGFEVPQGCDIIQLGYAILHCLGVSEDEL